MERTVKEVAARVGLPSRTVRYYDSIGLVSSQHRTESGYRLYGAEEESKLRFVRQAKSLGFGLDDIRRLIAAAESGCCGEVVPELNRLLDEKIAEIDAQIEDLRSFRERLASYRHGKGQGCGCSGHGAFCGCLNDVPLIKIEQMR
jgi:DNA-binding transcriptional MerR regulator